MTADQLIKLLSTNGVAQTLQQMAVQKPEIEHLKRRLENLASIIKKQGAFNEAFLIERNRIAYSMLYFTAGEDANEKPENLEQLKTILHDYLNETLKN